jgi:glycosyltransferase involved in cell wall biosynthesis
VTLPGTSTTLSETGAFISVDDDNRHLNDGGPQVLDAKAFAEHLDEIWEDEEKYSGMRHGSVDLIRAHYSSDVVVSRLLSTLS